MNKVNLLLIATNKYSVFVKPLLDSVEKWFLTKEDLRIFLFTDKENVDSRVFNIKIDHAPHPLITLLRYKTFIENKKFFEDKNTYTFYLDIDSLIVEEVNSNILPEKGVVVVEHPGFAGKPNQGSWETRVESMCYLPKNFRNNYFCGGFNGGTTTAFLKMSEICHEWIQKDLRRNIIPVHNDESALNTYAAQLQEKNVLSCEYCWPEGGKNVHPWFIWSELNPEAKPRILALNKNHEEIRN